MNNPRAWKSTSCRPASLDRREQLAENPLMEARSTLSGFFSNSALQPNRDLYKSHSFSSFFLSSPSSSQILFPKRVSFENLCYSLLSKSVSPRNRSLIVRSSQEFDFASGADYGNETGIRRKNLAVFVSGGGSNFRSIHEATLKGSVHGEVVVLVTNKSDCGGAKYARDSDIPVILFPKSNAEPEGLSPNGLVSTLRSYKTDFILLAGYLKLIPVELVRAYQKSIYNIHPSLLPAFGGKGYYGVKVHQAVIASGARYSGPTIHFVDEQYDTGRILAQRVVPVLADDTAEQLAARVLQKEHELYAEVAAALCEERVIWREDGVPIIRSRENPNKFR